MSQPSGATRTATLSVLFVDVVGSTDLRVQLGEDAADDLRRGLEAGLTEATGAHGGRVVKGLGDGVLAVFDAAGDAVAAATTMHQNAPQTVVLRIGISTGDVAVEPASNPSGDVFGTPVVEAARLCAAAQPGQILVADLVRSLARGRGGHVFEPVGELELKGLPDPVTACQVRWEPLVPARAPTRLPLPPVLDHGRVAAYAGRTTTLEKLTEAWLAARDGRGSATVLLSGEPGIGKTRTAAEIAVRAQADGAMVLHGGCDEGLSVPFQPFVEALGWHVAHDAEPVLGRLPGELPRLLPELTLRHPGLPARIESDPATEEYRLFEAVASWIVESSKQSGLLLVLDDLHWATRPTLLLVVHTIRVAAADPAARLLLVGTYRDTELDRVHPLSAVLADLRRLPSVGRIDLAGLDPDEVVAMAEAAAGHELTADGLGLMATIHAETDGNPFFIGEVFRHLVEIGQLRLVEGRWQIADYSQVEIPQGVRDVVGRRLGRLSEAANRALTVAAAVGQDFDVDLLAAVVDLDEAALLDGLDEACRARLVVETGADGFRFAHAVVRSTLYGELSATRRRRMHARLVEALEKLRPSDAAALARHALAAGPVGGDVARAVGYLCAAAEQAAATRALAEAEQLFAHALELLEDGEADERTRIALLCGLGEAQRDQSDPAFRDTLLGAAAAALAIGDADLAARASTANYVGTVARVGAVDREAVTQLERTLVLLGSERSARAALVNATLVLNLTWDPQLTVARRLELVERAFELALESDDPRVLAEVHARAAAPGMVVARQRPEALAFAERAIAAADRTGDPALQAENRYRTAMIALGLGELAAARRLTAEAVTLVAGQCPLRVVMLVTAMAAQFPGYDDDLAGAEEACAEVRRLAEECGAVDAATWVGVLRSHLAHLTGRLGEMAEEWGAAADRLDWPMFRLAQVEGLCAANRLDEARALVAEHGLNAAAIPQDLYALVGWGTLAEVALYLRDPELGAELEAALRPHRHLWSSSGLWVKGPGCLHLGQALGAQGRWVEAEECFDEADRLLTERGLHPYLPLVALDRAHTLAAAGEHSRAAEIARREQARALERGLPRLAEQFAAPIAK